MKKAAELSEPLIIMNARMAAAIINGLCMIGVPPPEELVLHFFKKQFAIRLILLNVFKYMFKTYSNEFSESVLRNTMVFFSSEPILIEAVLQIQNPPHYALDQIKKTFVSTKPPRDVAITFIKNASRIGQLNVLSYSTLCAIAFSSQVFGQDNENEISEFYCHCLLHVAHTTVEKLFIMISDSNPKKGVELAKNTVSHCPQLIGMIVNFLCTDGAIAYIKEWCQTYEFIISKVGEQPASQLLQFLLNSMSNEIKIGHITTESGSKVILIPEMFPSMRMRQAAVRGHREIAMMLEAYSYSNDLSHAIDVICFALTAHTFPLLFSIKMILIRLPEITVRQFFDRLIKANYNMKIMFLKLSEMLINMYTNEFFDYVLDTTIGLIFHCNISVVRCLAIRNLSQYQSIAIENSQIKKIITIYPSLSKLNGNAERDTILSIGLLKPPVPMHKQISGISSTPVIPRINSKFGQKPNPKKKLPTGHSGPIPKEKLPALSKRPMPKSKLHAAHSIGLMPRMQRV